MNKHKGIVIDALFLPILPPFFAHSSAFFHAKAN